jgi:hypothetical protein
MEVRDRPSLRRRSGEVEMEAVLVGAAPTSRVGSVLPDGPGAVSEIGMLKRGTGVGRQL